MIFIVNFYLLNDFLIIEIKNELISLSFIKFFLLLGFNLVMYLYIMEMNNNFYKYFYLIGFLALLIAIVTIYSVLSEINLFFTEKIKI